MELTLGVIKSCNSVASVRLTLIQLLFPVTCVFYPQSLSAQLSVHLIFSCFYSSMRGIVSLCDLAFTANCRPVKIRCSGQCSPKSTGQHDITHLEQQPGVVYCEILTLMLCTWRTDLERRQSSSKSPSYSLVCLSRGLEGAAVVKMEYRFPSNMSGALSWGKWRALAVVRRAES